MGTGNWFLVAYLSKNVGDISKLYNRKQGIGNRELAPCFLYWCIIPKF